MYLVMCSFRSIGFSLYAIEGLFVICSSSVSVSCLTKFLLSLIIFSFANSVKNILWSLSSVYIVAMYFRSFWFVSMRIIMCCVEFFLCHGLEIRITVFYIIISTEFTFWVISSSSSILFVMLLSFLATIVCLFFYFTYWFNIFSLLILFIFAAFVRANSVPSFVGIFDIVFFFSAFFFCTRNICCMILVHHRRLLIQGDLVMIWICLYLTLI